jgi:5-methylcytosine-specific restriction endonuclease McrA
MKRALLLNADWSPLHFINERRAFNLVYKGRAEIVLFDDRLSIWDDYIMTPSMKYENPATIRLLTRISKKWKPPRFRKRVLFNRDNWTCQYCNKKLFHHNVTIDHVLPKSKGGVTSWRNCVASCKPCNKRKGDKLLSDFDMQLKKKPVEPSALHYWDESKGTIIHPDWNTFVPSA